MAGRIKWGHRVPTSKYAKQEAWHDVMTYTVPYTGEYDEAAMYRAIDVLRPRPWIGCCGSAEISGHDPDAKTINITIWYPIGD